MRWYAVLAVILLGGCSAGPQIQNYIKNCDYASISGDEFVVQPIDVGYSSIHDWYYDYPMKKMDKLAHVNQRGKLIPGTRKDKYYTELYFAVLDSCQYVTIRHDYSYMRTKEDMENQTNIYFVKTLDKAKELVGSSIWLNPRARNGGQFIFKNENMKMEMLKNIEQLEVVDIDRRAVPSITDSGAFYLKVKNESGEIGFIPYNQEYFLLENPIDNSWPKNVIKTIKERKISIGMNRDQAKLAWGNPDSINKSVGSWGTHEQWVYGSQYLYFENGVLASFQSN